MASRLMSFLSARQSALLFSAIAALFSLGLYWRWLSHEAQQRTFLAHYQKLAPHFSVGELDRLAPSTDSLVMFAVTTGIMIAVAVVYWRQGPR